MNRILLPTFLALSLTGIAREIPPPPAAADVFPEWAALKDNSSARKLITTAYETAPVKLGKSGAVRLPVRFTGNQSPRANWDIAISTDLRIARGIQFDFYTADLSPFSSFSFYFRSGDGWYSTSFSPGTAGAWQHVVIDKADTKVEGQPAGWKNIDAIRISGWRGRDVDTLCAIANLARTGANPDVLVLRADSNIATAGGESGGLLRYAATVSATLDRLGVRSAQLADTDLTPDLLAAVKLIVLPYNPKLPASTRTLLQSFVEAGGKLLACYTLDRSVARLLGLQTTGSEVPADGPFTGFSATPKALVGQPAFAPQASWRSHSVEAAGDSKARVIANWRDAQATDTGIPAITMSPTGTFVGHVWLGNANDDSDALMRAIIGELVPTTWQQAAGNALAKIGRIEGAAGLDELSTSLQPQAPAIAKEALQLATKARADARQLIKAADWPASIAASKRASTAALRAWCLCRKPRTPEHRAFWCHSAFGLNNKDWDASIRLLKQGGFNAILPNMLWAGLTYYPSDLLPAYSGLAEHGDQLAQCLAACKSHGVACHVWKVNWNTGNKAPKEFLDRMRDEHRSQVTFAGTPKDGWLCPSHPANQDLEVASMLEVAERYDVDGIHFDYIRYPDSNSCFCDGCRKRFEKLLGRPVASWPADTRKDPEIRERWLDFRRSNITTVVRRVAEGAQAVRPGVKISAAVFRNWPSDRDSIGQDWKVWCDKGWLDFVCPMDYIDSNPLFRSTVATQKSYTGKVPLYPGIGLSVWKNPRDAVKLARQIEIVRDLGVPGFTVFNFDANAEAVLPYLRLGSTSK